MEEDGGTLASIEQGGIFILPAQFYISSVAGRESVEVYVKAERENTPNAQLKGLAKVELQPGETKQVKIHLPLAAFALCNEEGTPIVEAGSYSVYVGASQPDARSVALMGQAPAKLTVTQSATQALDL